MKNKYKFLVIGSNSFSGSALINYILSQNEKVIGVSRSLEKKSFFLAYKNNINHKKNFLFHKIDLNKNLNKLLTLIKKYNIEYIINFSSQSMVAESWNNPLDWYKTNILSTIKFYESIKSYDFIKKIIHFTTPEVYGSTGKFIKENLNFNPSTPYALSRATSDLHLNFMYHQYKFPIIFTRAANTYGEYQPLYRIIPKTIYSIKKQKKLHLHGGGRSKRSFIHSDDVNDAIWKIIHKGFIGNTYHISSNEFISIRNLIYRICQILEYDPKDLLIIDEERKGKDLYYKLDSSKIQKNLNWKSKIDIEEGIQRTVTWIDSYIDQFNINDLKYVHKK